MGHTTKAKRLKFRTNLEEQAVYQISFLNSVKAEKALEDPDVLRRAVYRYEKYWLPLAVEHTEECLSAPIDIEWAWHCHMLSPTAYEKDCKHIVGETINHKLYSNWDFIENQKKSENYWTKKYGSDSEPFYLDKCKQNENISDFCSQIGYDIIAAAERQREFLYQVSLPHYTDVKFLESSVRRYKQFIYLKLNFPKKFLVPCYDIDLIWHTHQLNPVVYKEDMVRILNHLFNHDDTVTDRSEGSKLNTSDKMTRQCWKDFYKEAYFLCGAMYRGESPTGSLYKLTADDVFSACTKTCIFTVEKLTLTWSSLDTKPSKKIRLTCSSRAGSTQVKKWFSLNPTKEWQRGASTTTWSGVGHYLINTRNANLVHFKLDEIKGSSCFGIKSQIGANEINILPLVESKANAATGGRIDTKIKLGSDADLHVLGYFSPPSAGPTFLFLKPGQYETAVIPENIQDMWGPVPLGKLSPGVTNYCQVASHRLANHLGSVEYTARIIHSQPLMMSVIQVYFHDKLCSVAHLIGSDQLPLQTQVVNDRLKSVSLNPKRGERAVLIKSSAGDWGILIGRWAEFRRGVAKTKGGPGIPGKPGHLSVRFYKISTDEVTKKKLYEESQHGVYKYSYSLGSVQMDLLKGFMQIDSPDNEIAENVALTFAVCLLHVLCVPRARNWREGQKVKPNVTTRGNATIRAVPSDEMALVAAAGLQCSTPSNHYIHKSFGTNLCAMCVGGGVHEAEYDIDWADLPDADGDGGCTGTACGGGDGGGDGAGCGGRGGGCGGCGGGCGGCGG